jgi:hypothetical protein
MLRGYLLTFGQHAEEDFFKKLVGSMLIGMGKGGAMDRIYAQMFDCVARPASMPLRLSWPASWPKSMATKWFHEKKPLAWYSAPVAKTDSWNSYLENIFSI